MTSLGCIDAEIGKKLCIGEVVAQWEYARHCTMTSITRNGQEICKNELDIFV
jgi:hypothetical protein